MDASGVRPRMLFVDDEESIRFTLPPLLQKHGFDVVAAANVAEALVEINAQPFQVLLADLNIEKPGDGFLVISAMRHLQPDCVNLILTGYPAFETALQALEAQVDDYFVKPADIDALVGRIRRKLGGRAQKEPANGLRLVALVDEREREIAAAVLAEEKRDPRISGLSLRDQERMGPLPGIFKVMRTHLAADAWAGRLGEKDQEALTRYCKVRDEQGYSSAMILREFQLIGEAVFDVLLTKDTSLGFGGLVSEMFRLMKVMNWLGLESLEICREPTSNAV
jgi:ActR/RegA family two-component response regulator